MNNTRYRTSRLSLWKIIITLIMFILLWTIVTDAWGYSQFLFGASKGSWGNYLYGFLSRLVWAIPAIILLWVYKKEIPTTWKELFLNRPHIKPFIITVVVIVVYCFAGMIYSHGGMWINPEFDFSKNLINYVTVVFVEELVYRGWGLNALSAFLSERKANLVSTVFFVLLHLPAYFIKLYLYGTFSIAAFITQCVFVFVLGLLFGYLYNKGKSLWSPMTVHFLADFLSIMIIG